MDDPQIKDFVDNLNRINLLAEAAPGFVWRLMTPAGDATAIQVFNDPFIIINMSVWESIDALYQYTYYSDHVDIFRRRKEWFGKLELPHMALWWIEDGNYPDEYEGKARLEYMAQHGITPHAFTFKERFSPDDLRVYNQTP
jgi:hypothetical protein